MIDIHAHILPGVDDGPSTIEIASAMLAMAAADGITHIVATPHANLHYQFDPFQCEAAMRRLRACSSGRPRLYSGCELHLTPENLHAVRTHPAAFTLNGKNCILLELPENVLPPTVDAALHLLRDAGLQPIIAHGERNFYIQRHLDYAGHLVSMGCFLQVTGGSFLGGFGPVAEQTARHLIGRRLIHFVASDAHGVENRRPLLSRAYRHVAGEYGESIARLLFLENPGAAIDGAPVCPMPRPRRLPWRWFFSGKSGRSNPALLRTAPP